MEIASTKKFNKHAQKILTTESLVELKRALVINPEIGVVIPRQKGTRLMTKEKEQEIYKAALQDQIELESGEQTPGSVEKVVKRRNGDIEFISISQEMIIAAAMLKRSRSRAAMTQKAFSEILGIPLSTYRKYEQHESRIPKPALKLAQIAAMDVSLIPS